MAPEQCVEKKKKHFGLRKRTRFFTRQTFEDEKDDPTHELFCLFREVAHNKPPFFCYFLELLALWTCLWREGFLSGCRLSIRVEKDLNSGPPQKLL
jgi:hypothetical protein